MVSAFVVWLITLGRGRYAGSEVGTGMASQQIPGWQITDVWVSHPLRPHSQS